MPVMPGGWATWLRWSWRDLRARWLQVAAISLIVALGAGVYTGLGSMPQWRRANYDASYDALASHDLLVTLSTGSTVPAGALALSVAPQRNVEGWVENHRSGTAAADAAARARSTQE